VALRIEGYVIVSADGMLADARNVMPDELKFEGDKAFFTAALDRADLILHGRNSYEDQPNSPQAQARHPDADGRCDRARSVQSEKPQLWNPAGASFEAACAHAGRAAGTVAVIGGPGVFGMFMDRYDAFWLSVAPHVACPAASLAFPASLPARRRKSSPRMALQAGDAQIA
jgi:hypothetical protein